MTSDRVFVRLDGKRHDREAFTCGRPPVDGFLRARAAKHAELGVSRTWVLPGADVPGDALRPIVSFFTATQGIIDRGLLPTSMAKRYPLYPLPVIVLAQLGVDTTMQGRGFGDVTLGVALRKFAVMSADVAAVAVVLDCLDDEAERFYARYAFERLDDRRPDGGLLRLHLPIRTVLELYGPSR